MSSCIPTKDWDDFVFVYFCESAEMTPPDLSTVEESIGGASSAHLSQNAQKGGETSWKQWTFFLIGAAIFTAALALVAVAITAGKIESCIASSKDAKLLADKEHASTRNPRLFGVSRDSLGSLRVHMTTGEQIVIDSATIELRSATGQLLQHAALPLVPLSANAALQSQGDPILQGQAIEPPTEQQHRRLMAAHMKEIRRLQQLQQYQLHQHHLQQKQFFQQLADTAGAAALHRAMAVPPEVSQLQTSPPLDQQSPKLSHQQQTHTNPTPKQEQPHERPHGQQSTKMRLHVRRMSSASTGPNKYQTPDQPIPVAVPAAGPGEPTSAAQLNNSTPRMVWPAFEGSRDKDGFCPAGSEATEGEGCELQQRSEGGSEGEVDQGVSSLPLHASDTISSATPLTEPHTELVSSREHQTELSDTVSTEAAATAGAANGSRAPQPLATAPQPVVPLLVPLHSSPQRNLFATQAVGGMAVVADALSRVGQAMRTLCGTRRLSTLDIACFFAVAALPEDPTNGG
ncbi:hypothetical protein cyc_02251 [Cyclospora cayetanensis]|uniref:Uncharacterized protein n=1 Tax=Cyclospora cayetanensis TaxID=88456 RepID=A0A1D3D168_9EIME|nr:hypothetical protein cyc_02251 [Cyclospora cayetanensis]